MEIAQEIILRQAQDERVAYHHPLVVSLSNHRVQTISHFWSKALKTVVGFVGKGRTLQN